MNDWSSILGWVAVLAPLIGGLSIAYGDFPRAVTLAETWSAWWDARYHACRTYDASRHWSGNILGPLAWIASALTWGFHKVYHLSEGMEQDSMRAGLRIAAWFYIGALSVVVVASALYVVLALVALAVGFWLLMKFLGSGDGDTSPPRREYRRIEPRPQPAHGPVTDGPYRRPCQCAHGCQTSAIITEFECGCRHVEILNDRLAGSDCTDFSGLRRRCGAPGTAGG